MNVKCREIARGSSTKQKKIRKGLKKQRLQIEKKAWRSAKGFGLNPIKKWKKQSKLHSSSLQYSNGWQIWFQYRRRNVWSVIRNWICSHLAIAKWLLHCLFSISTIRIWFALPIYVSNPVRSLTVIHIGFSSLDTIFLFFNLLDRKISKHFRFLFSPSHNLFSKVGFCTCSVPLLEVTAFHIPFWIIYIHYSVQWM